MASTLVVNTGSSSKKYALFTEGREVLRIAVSADSSGILYEVRRRGISVTQERLDIGQYQTVLDHVLTTARKYGCITAAGDITRVAIRVVSPGTVFQTHAHIDTRYIEALQNHANIAPLHIPPILQEIEQLQQRLPQGQLIAVSDSAFHTSIPPVAHRYSIPQEDAEEFDIKRFGYHGISVQSVIERLPRMYEGDMFRCIVCHVGSGISVTAVRDGKSIDTSMGFSPGSGVPMASRSGDLDTGALLALMDKRGMGVRDAYTYIQTKGGLLSTAGESDIRHILERYACGEQMAIHALGHVAYYIKKYIGAYTAVLGGVDVVIFTATAGERSPQLRELCVGDMEGSGLLLDRDRNESLVGKGGLISREESPVQIAVVQTQEMAMMARIAERV